MALTPGFRRRQPAADHVLPPGQYEVHDFPVLSAGPTPRLPTDRWTLTLTTETGAQRTWSWDDLLALPQSTPTVDLHCVTRWSKFGTHWAGVDVDVLLDGVTTAASYVVVGSSGGYTTNLPLADLRGGKAWVVHGYEGAPLRPEHGGPVRMIVPHLYFWKSAKWVRSITLTTDDQPGFWETLGYHDYGDPWREQRYSGD